MSLFRFNLDCGRMGSLEGVFEAEQHEVDTLIGKTVYFGEVLGKHSEIIVKIENSHITLLTSDDEFISKAREYGISFVGTNPFDYDIQ